MHHVLLVGLAYFTLTLLAAGARAASGPTLPPDSGPAVSFPGRARLADLMRELDRQFPGVCVADSSAGERNLTQPAQDAQLTKLLPRISRELDRFWLRKGRVLVLQRRFTDPEEEPELELEEARATAGDLFRLITPFVPRRLGEQHIRDKKSFADTLSPEQQRAMMGGGLTLAQLPETQRSAWLELNLAHAYASSHLEIERAARCLETWERSTLSDLRLNGVMRQDYGVEFSHPSLEEGKGRCRLNVPGAGRSAPDVPEGVDLPAKVITLPADLKPQWEMPAEELTLGQLVDRLAQADGPRVRVPEYARGRRLWVSSNAGTRAEVLDAVGLLWGWDLTPHPDGGYRLERPRLAPARNPQELHDRMLRAVPPSLLHHLRLRDRGGSMRLARQMALVAEAAERIAGRNWTSVPVNKLDALTQRRLANCMVVRQLGVWFTNHARGPAPAWLTHPERGVLTLSGPVSANTNPLLKFSVFKDDGKTRTEDFWGWYVNTSSLSRREGPGRKP